MLILQRREGESVHIGQDIEVTILSVESGRVRIAITAPTDVPILRSELVRAQAANQDSAQEQSAPAELLDALGSVLLVEHTQQPAGPLKPVAPPDILKSKKN